MCPDSKIGFKDLTTRPVPGAIDGHGEARRIIPIRHADGDPGNAVCPREPYVLMVLGDSMQPEFLEGDIVVVETAGDADDGDYVIARHADGWSLRKLMRIDGVRFLVALNPAYRPEPLERGNDIRGVVTQRTHPRDRGRRKRYID